MNTIFFSFTVSEICGNITQPGNMKLLTVSLEAVPEESTPGRNLGY
jgi:hypothetical protein